MPDPKKKTRSQELDTNPNRLKNESEEFYKNRIKYNDFRIRQQDDKNVVSKYWNKIEDSINNEDNYFLKTAEKTITSPIRFAKYLYDKTDLRDTNKYRNNQKKSELNQKGLSSAMDVAELGLIGGLDKGLKAKPLMTQFAKKAGTYIGGQMGQDLGFGIYNQKQINDNMKQYAQGGELTRFNEGGTHEQNPNGGIPQGPNATVEQGETSTKTPNGKYIYSNRLYINEDLVKQFNLPNSIKGKTFADASKIIDKPFKDRNSNPDKLTHKEHLDRLKQAQETLKQQEQQHAEQIAQSMQSNQQEVPDMMNGQIPEGMEEYTEQPDQNQMFLGGDLNLAEVGNITGGLAGLAGKASPYLGAAGGAMSLGSLAQGNGASTNKAQSAFSGAATGAQAGMAFGPWGAGIGAAVGLGAGLLGANKANKEKQKNILDYSKSINNQFSENQFGDGGDLEEDPINPLFKPTNTIPQVGAGSPSNFLGYSIPQQKFKKDIAGSADYNTNIVQNLHNTIGITPSTPGYGTHIGNKTALAYNNWAKTNNPDDYLETDNPLNNFYGSKADPLESGKRFSDYMYNSSSEYTTDLKNKMGLTSQGYKFNGAETPDTSMLKSQEKPFVEPTGVRQGMEDYYQKNKTTTNSDTNNNNGNWLDRNGGKILKYAPVAMSALQLAKLKKPAYERLDRLTNRFKPEYVDEQSLQNIANSEMNNSINSISQLGGSQGAVRNSILGAGLNKTKALSNAYMDASAQNRQTNIAGQQFNLGIDQANINQANQELDINDRNQANYRNEKSKYLSSIGTDLGSIGKEEVNKNQIAEALGYDVDGDYVINRVTKERIHKDELAKRIAAKEKTTTNAYGGYLKMNKIGRK